MWANAHSNYFTVALRILFGAFIFFKGLFFLEQTDYLYHLVSSVSGQGIYFMMVHYVAVAHLCGGFLITLGLLTRWCALVQLHVLAGAVLINFMGVMNLSNLVQASLGLLLCSFFVYYGSGRHSVDHSLKLHV